MIRFLNCQIEIYNLFTKMIATMTQIKLYLNNSIKEIGVNKLVFIKNRQNKETKYKYFIAELLRIIKTGNHILDT